MTRLEIIETCLYAADLDSARDFYTRILGLELFQEESGRHLFFRCGARMLLIFNPERTNDPSGDLPPHGVAGAAHVAFGVPASEWGLWTGRIREAGISIERQIEWPRGGSSIYFRDPAGNSVELTTAATWQISESSLFHEIAE